MMLLPDHPTPVAIRTHTKEAVPFIIAGEGVETDNVTVFTEAAGKAGSKFIKKGHKLMNFFVKG